MGQLRSVLSTSNTAALDVATLTCSPCPPSVRKVDVHNNLGDLWRSQGAGGSAPARACYTAALALSPAYAPAWRGLGDLAREAGEHVGAVRAYREALRLRPDYADALSGCGVSLKALGRLPEARACLEAVVALRPRCALAAGTLAGLYYDAGLLDASITIYSRALTLEPNFPEVGGGMSSICVYV